MGWEEQERDEQGRWGSGGGGAEPEEIRINRENDRRLNEMLKKQGIENKIDPREVGRINVENDRRLRESMGGPRRPEDVTRGVAAEDNDGTKSARAALKGIESGQLWKHERGYYVTVDWKDEESGDVIVKTPSQTRGREGTDDAYRMPADRFRERHTQVKRAVHKPLGWDIR